MKYHFSTKLHITLQILAFLLNAMVIFFLVYSAMQQDKEEALFCMGFLIFSLLLYNRIKFGITKVTFDENQMYIDSDSDEKTIPLTDITSVRRGVITYKNGDSTGKIMLPNFYFWDKSYRKLKAFSPNISRKSAAPITTRR